MTADEELLRKYEDLYRVTKEILEREIKRDASVEEKALRYLTVTGLLIAAAGYAGKEPLAGVMPPTSLVAWLCIIVFGLFWLFLLAAVITMFRVLSIRDIHLPLNEGLVEYYDRHSYMDILYASSLNHAELDKSNQIVTNRRANLLGVGHHLILSAIFLFAIFTGLTMARMWMTVKTQQTINRIEVQDATTKNR